MKIRWRSFIPLLMYYVRCSVIPESTKWMNTNKQTDIIGILILFTMSLTSPAAVTMLFSYLQQLCVKPQQFWNHKSKNAFYIISHLYDKFLAHLNIMIFVSSTEHFIFNTTLSKKCDLNIQLHNLKLTRLINKNNENKTIWNTWFVSHNYHLVHMSLFVHVDCVVYVCMIVVERLLIIHEI